MKLKTILIIAVCANIFFGCSSSPRMIDEPKLEKIIIESMMTSALIDRENRKIDSMDAYASLLQQENVTLEDVKYTVEQMASRKSNPLKNMFERINADIDSMNARAAYRYNRKVMFDTAAGNFVRDTLIFKDTLIKGDPSKYTDQVAGLKPGEYVFEFFYKSNESYEIGVPMVKIYLARKFGRSDRSTWMNRSTTQQKFIQKIKIDDQDGYDTIIFGFSPPSKKKGVKIVDTSYVKQFAVYYNPPISEARQRYFEHLTKFKTNFKNDTIKVDSLLPWIGGGKNREKLRFDIPRWSADVDTVASKRN